MRLRDRNPFTVGLVMVIVIGIGTFLGFTKDIPFVNEPYEIRLAFRDSSGIVSGSPVRIAGVDVGKVTGVEHAGPDGRAAEVTIAVRDNGRPVHDDATAHIRPRIFLEGNFFVELEPGTPSAPELEADATIPADRTSNAVQIDQVLKVLQTDVRASLRTALKELGETGEAGGARAFNRSLADQSAAYKNVAIVAEAFLGRKPGDLGDFVRDQGRVSAALDRDRAAVRDLVVDFNKTAAALADRNVDLRAAIDELPDTLRAALPALSDVNAALPSVRAFARSSLPAVRSTKPAADALIPLVRELRGLVSQSELRGLAADLREATPPLAQLAASSVGTLEEVRQLSSCTNEVLVPYGNSTVDDPNFKADGPVHTELPKSLVGLSGESRSFDANGQWFKVLGQGGLETFSLGNGLFGVTSEPFLGTNPPAQRERPPLRPEVPCETQEPPDLRTQPGPAPARVRVNPGSAASRERGAKARLVAIDEMRRMLRREGLKATVTERPATSAQIRRDNALIKQAGR